MLEQRLILVTGKGGVGRSALTAALALRSAHFGRRVLAVAMTDDLGLAAHLGRDRLSYSPQEIRPGLHALAIHRPSALDEYLKVQLGVPKVTRMGPVARAFDALASTAPGIREVITIGKVLWEVRKGTWDVVIADGPPLGQMASHLRAPRTVSELVPVGRIETQAAWMTELMDDPAVTGLLIVTLAEELPVTETTEALAWLSEAQVVPEPIVVINRVLHPLGVPASQLQRLKAGPAREAARLHDTLVGEQQAWLEKLPAGPRLPYLFGLLTPAEVSARLAELWEDP